MPRQQSIPSPPIVSLAMIARDAADLVRLTLESMRPYVDQMVVVDTGSTDSTRQTAQQLGAQVIDHPWRDDFSQARNAALPALTGQWVLWLDAGESLSAQAAGELKQFILHQADPAQAYMLLVEVPAAAGEVAGEQVGRIRLHPNRAGLRFTGRVREQIAPALAAAGIGLEGLPWRIVRTAHEHMPEVKLQKARRNLHLAELEIREHGRQPSLLITLGTALEGLGDVQGAVAAFRLALDEAEPESRAMREAYYGLLSAYNGLADQRAAQMALCLEAIDHFPLDAQLLCAMGGYLESQGQLDLAARSYRVAFTHGTVDPESWHVSGIHEIAAVCLSMLLQLQNDDESARGVLQQALERNPHCQRARRQLIELHVKHDRRREALAEFDQLGTDGPQREALRSAIRGACLAATQNWGSAQAYLETAYTAGCRDPLCLRWLAITLMAVGDAKAARRVLEDWQHVEPRNVEAARYLESLSPAPAASAGTQYEPASDVHGTPRHLRIDTTQPSRGAVPSFIQVTTATTLAQQQPQ